MVPSNQCDAVWIPDFQTEKEEERFEGVEAPVDEVAHEEVIGIWYVATDTKKFHEVVELAMYITTDRDGGIDGDYIAFLDQELTSLVAKLSDLRFWNGTARAQLRNGSMRTSYVSQAMVLKLIVSSLIKVAHIERFATHKSGCGIGIAKSILQLRAMELFNVPDRVQKHLV